jgi:hypothetical protein
MTEFMHLMTVGGSSATPPRAPCAPPRSICARPITRLPRLAGTVGQTACVPVSQTIEGEKSPRIKGFEYADGTVETSGLGQTGHCPFHSRLPSSLESL